VLFVFSGNVQAEDKYPLFNNIVEDFKYLATAPARLDAKSVLLTLGAVGVGVELYFADENIRGSSLAAAFPITLLNTFLGYNVHTALWRFLLNSGRIASNMLKIYYKFFSRL